MFPTKKCYSCKEVKSLSEFHKHPSMRDGHINKCKICVLAYTKQWRQNNLSAIQVKDRARGRGRYKDEVAYRSLHKDRDIARKQNWIVNNPEKRNAHNILNNAIRDGILTKQPCVRCGSNIRIHGHHDDYSKPLEVIWLCPKHHGERHRELNEITRKLTTTCGRRHN